MSWKQMTRKAVLLIVTAFLVMAAVTVPVLAESKASKNKKARALYEKKAVELLKETRPTLSQIVRKYGDFTGDGIIDAFYIYPYKAGSGDEFQIYTYKNGKTIRLLRDGGYGLAKFTFYKKSKSLIMNQYGHGGEAYRYYKMIGGVYNEVASKGRRSTSGGSNHNGSWEYSTGNGLSYRTLTKSQFQSIIKGLKKGKKVILSFE